MWPCLLFLSLFIYLFFAIIIIFIVWFIYIVSAFLLIIGIISIAFPLLDYPHTVSYIFLFYIYIRILISIILFFPPIPSRTESHFYSKHGRMNLDPEFSTSERLQKRAARFSGGLDVAPPKKKKQPLNITKTISNTKILKNCFTIDGDDIDWTSMHIVGTSTTLEKNYLRLTAVSSVGGC